MTTMTRPRSGTAPRPTTELLAASDWVSIPEAIRLSGASRTTLYRYMDTGRLPYRIVRRNGRRLVRRVDALDLREYAVEVDGVSATATSAG